jgi:hypothetical protein
VNTGGFRARTRERGKHRTEVTEATEGELFWWPRRRWGEAPLACAGSFTIFSCLRAHQTTLPLSRVLTRKPPVFTQALPSTNPKSPSVASVTSVRCFPPIA